MAEIIFQKKGKTAYVILNRPEQKNAINLGMRRGLREAWERIAQDSEICSVIITGGDKIFSAGQDLIELAEFRKKEPVSDLLLNDLETFGANIKKPVIAAISGYCLGAGFLLTLMASDVRIASNTAIFGMPEVKVGVPLSLGIPPTIVKHFPPAIALELLMLGNNLTAEDAYRNGYVNKIVAPEDLLSEAERYANNFNELSPLLIKNIKEIVRFETVPDAKTIALSNTKCLLCRRSEDYIEGLKAYKEKRKAQWKGV
jgi:enoyl-CoA hydratase/carnithine racemase